MYSSIVNYHWDFGDDTTQDGSDLSSVGHIYNDPGIYSVTLTIRNEDDETYTSWNVTRIFDSTINYVGIENYHWDFGDGTTQDGSDLSGVSHIYNDPGIYSVTLTIRNESDETYVSGNVVKILDSAFYGGVENYYWDFGDGTTQDGSDLSSVGHIYTEPGLFFPQLTIRNGVDETSNNNGSIYVGVDYSSLSYNWDYGDGTTGSGAQSDHTYLQSGLYTVRADASGVGGDASYIQEDYITVWDGNLLSTTWLKVLRDSTATSESLIGSSILYNDRIVVVNGTNGEVVSSADGEVWERLPDFPGSYREGLSLCVHNNALYLMGGKNIPSGYPLFYSCNTTDSSIAYFTYSGEIYRYVYATMEKTLLARESFINSYGNYYISHIHCSGSGQYVLVVNWVSLKFSQNFGISWSDIIVPPENGTFLDILQCWVSSDGQKFLILQDGGILLYSTNRGQSWSNIGEEDQYYSGCQMSEDGSHIVAFNSWFPATLFLSEDGGNTWTNEVHDSMIDCRISDDGQKVFILSYNSIKESTNFGQSWTEIPFSGISEEFQVSRNGNYIIAGNYGELELYNRGTSSWDYLISAERCFGENITNNGLSIIFSEGFNLKDSSNSGESFNDIPLNNTSDCWKFENNTWTCLNPRIGVDFPAWPGVISFNNKIWVFGGEGLLGWGLNSYTNYDTIYSSEDGVTWTLESETLPIVISRFPVVKYTLDSEEKIYIIGGKSGGEYDYLKHIYSSTDGVNWVKVDANPGWESRCNHAVLVYGGLLWVFGGLIYDEEEDYEIPTHDLWYSQDTINWVKLDTAVIWEFYQPWVTLKGPELFIGGGARLNSSLVCVLSGVRPIPNFLATPLRGSKPFNVQFTDQSERTVTSRLWEFGDGSVGSSLNPSHVYSIVGSKDVSLIARNEYGPSREDKEDYIFVGLRSWIKILSSSPWRPRTRSMCVFWKNEMWVIGGEGDELYKDIWKTPDGINWVEVFPEGEYFTARSGHEVVVHNDNLYVLGGYTEEGEVNDIWFSEDGTIWTRLMEHAPWASRSQFSSVSFNGYIWIMGGYGESFYENRSAEVWRSQDGVIWELIRDDAPWMNFYGGRINHRSISFNGKIFIIGGEFSRDVWSTEDGNDWTQLTDNCSPDSGIDERKDFGIFEYDNKIFIAGGKDDYNGNALNDMWYSSDGITWIEYPLGVSFSKRNKFGYARISETLFIFGGEGSILDDVWRFGDPPLPPIPSGTRSRVDIHGTLILKGDITCDGNIFLYSDGLVIPVPNEVNRTFYSCPSHKMISANGKSPLMLSLYENIVIEGTINGDGEGFEANFGPGANSLLLDNRGDRIPTYGATHAGLGSVQVPPYTVSDYYEEITITPEVFDEKEVVLKAAPIDLDSIAVNVIRGTSQIPNQDFRVVGRRLGWRGPGLEPYLRIGDILRIIYIGTTEKTYPSPLSPYGSYRAPTSIGSGSGAAAGGSGITLASPYGLTRILGSISVNGETPAIVESGGGSGGSVWVCSWNIDGNGSITAEGGGAIGPYAGGGGGGYIALCYRGANEFNGTMSVSGNDGGTEGLIYLQAEEPILEEKFTGTILNTKWWSILEGQVEVNNKLVLDTTSREDIITESEFRVSGNFIEIQVNTSISSGSDFYLSGMVLYSDNRNYAGIGWRSGQLVGFYSVDGSFALTGIDTISTEATFRLVKDSSLFSFQYLDSTFVPQTILYETLSELSDRDFAIRLFTDMDVIGGAQVETYRLTNQDILNKHIKLSGNPADASNITLRALNGPIFVQDTHYFVIDRMVSWDSSSLPSDILESLLSSGDQLQVMYTGDSSSDSLHAEFSNLKVYTGIIENSESPDSVIYVDSINGSDSFNGKRLSPLKNLFVATAWAKRGATVVLSDGTYNPAEIRKDLTIRGVDNGYPIITSRYSQDTTGSNWENSALTFKGCQGLVYNVILADSTYGVYAERLQNIEIRNCVLSRCLTGVNVSTLSRKPRIIRNTFIDSSTAVQFDGQVSDPVVYSNVVTNSIIGVNAIDCNGLIVSSNTFDGLNAGIILDSSSNGVIASNNITNSSLGIQISIDSTPVGIYSNNFFGCVVDILGTADESGNISEDPLYMDPGNYDFRIEEDSPNRGAGTGKYDNYFLDRRNVTRLGNTDIGAYEWIDGTHVPGPYYVSSGGDDYRGLGNLDSPYRTLDTAMRVADSSVFIYGGHYDSYYLNLKSQNILLNSLTIELQDFYITYITISQSNLSEKVVVIDGLFSGFDNLLVTPLEGPTQIYGVDYTCFPGGISWNNLGMDGILDVGDTLQIIYPRHIRAKNTLTLRSYYPNINVANSVFVSMNGNDDSGNGSFEFPYQTISKALEDSSSGVDVIALAGTYPLFTGVEGHTLAVMGDNTGVEDKYSRRYLQSLFEERNFFNHTITASSLWSLTYTGDSSASIMDGYLALSYDGTNVARADSVFSFSSDYEVSFEMRSALGPVFLQLSNGVSSITAGLNGNDWTTSIMTGGEDYRCSGSLGLNPLLVDDFFTDYICLDSIDIRNGFAPLSYIPLNPDEIGLNIVGGTSQELGVDLIIKGGRIIWAGLPIEEDLHPGDVIRAIYRAQDLSAPVLFKITLTGVLVRIFAKSNGSWHKLVVRKLFEDPAPLWNTSVFINSLGISSYVRGYVSKYLAVSDNFVDTDEDRPYLAKTDRRTITLY